jgi:basic membrane lipoprotein Med (substrate-binding protein (PBP1-ABC) superfamily)
LRCGALAAVLRGALAGDLAGDLAGVLEAGAALTAGLVAALPEDAVLSVLAAFALGAEEMVVSFMVYRLSKN